jgi:hypothetical protein
MGRCRLVHVLNLSIGERRELPPRSLLSLDEETCVCRFQYRGSVLRPVLCGLEKCEGCPKNELLCRNRNRQSKPATASEMLIIQRPACTVSTVRLVFRGSTAGQFRFARHPLSGTVLAEPISPEKARRVSLQGQCFLGRCERETCAYEDMKICYKRVEICYKRVEICVKQVDKSGKPRPRTRE